MTVVVSATRYNVDDVVNLWDPLDTTSYGNSLIITTGTFPK
jgi:hypothetical protein